MNDEYNEEDDGYNDEYYDYDNNHGQYKWYFKFDVGNTPLSEWIQKTIGDMIYGSYDISNVPGFPVKKFPVNSWNPNTANPKKFQYLGSNYHNDPIWKSKYWVIDPIDQEYKLHLQHHAGHFVQQPQYYRGMFDILN